MKKIHFIVIASGMVLLGFGAGYLFFAGPQEAIIDDHAGHTTEAEEEEIWTCSMHPQIRQSEPGNCPICGMDLIPLGSTASDNPLVLEMTNEAAKLADIQTATVGSDADALNQTLMLSGKIQADERRVSSQVAHVPGRIEKLFVTFTGEHVNAGQKLATIYSPEVVSAQRELIEAQKMQDARPQLLEAAKNKLRYWKIPAATIDMVLSSGEIQPEITLYAEHSGVVINRRVSVGDYVKEGSVLLDISDLKRLWVLFDAYEEDLAKIRLGDRISFTVPSSPGRKFGTKISFIDPMIDPKTRVASLRGEVSNSNGLLKPEMFVKGTHETTASSGKSLLTVPKSAVLWTGTRSVVYVADIDASVPSFEYREITLGQGQGNHYIVLDGLDAGEEVVVNGAFVIDAAAQLNNQASMMNRNVRLTGQVDAGPDFRSQTPDAFRQQLMQVVINYIKLKDALVASDAADATQQATGVETALKSVDMGLLSGDAHLYWMEKMSAMQAHHDKIVNTPDIEEQRKQFSFFTAALVDALTAFGVSGDTVYLHHCPMAFDNTGADWLSAEKAIRNPYFGDKMLKCGSVKTTFAETSSTYLPSNSSGDQHQH